MKRVFFGLIILVVFTACETASDRKIIGGSNNDQRELDSLKREKARLQREIKALKANNSDVDPPFMADTPVEKPTTEPIEKTTKEPVEQPIQKNNDKGAIHYFKGTKKVAVRITSWKDNKREVICYAMNGDVTYSFEDVRLSYTKFTEVVSFHENGAANHIHNSFNPGASLYYYETNYTFDEENYPVKKEEIEYPQTLEKMLDNVRQWDREKKAWV